MEELNGGNVRRSRSGHFCPAQPFRDQFSEAEEHFEGFEPVWWESVKK